MTNNKPWIYYYNGEEIQDVVSHTTNYLQGFGKNIVWNDRLYFLGERVDASDRIFCYVP